MSKAAPLAAAIIAFVLAMLALGVVAAQTEPSIQVVPSTVGSGQRVTVFGKGFCGSPGCSDVTITLNTQALASNVQVGPDGTFRYMFIATQIPDQYRVTARQTAENGSTLDASYGLLIVPADVPPGQTAPVETLPPTATPRPTGATATASGGPTATASGGPTATASPAPSGGGQATPTPTASVQNDGGSSALPWILAALAAAVVLLLLLIWRRLRRAHPR